MCEMQSIRSSASAKRLQKLCVIEGSNSLLDIFLQHGSMTRRNTVAITEAISVNKFDDLKNCCIVNL
jgi:hypothetical protein